MIASLQQRRKPATWVPSLSDRQEVLSSLSPGLKCLGSSWGTNPTALSLPSCATFCRDIPSYLQGDSFSLACFTDAACSSRGWAGGARAGLCWYNTALWLCRSTLQGAYGEMCPTPLPTLITSSSENYYPASLTSTAQTTFWEHFTTLLVSTGAHLPGVSLARGTQHLPMQHIRFPSHVTWCCTTPPPPHWWHRHTWCSSRLKPGMRTRVSNVTTFPCPDFWNGTSHPAKTRVWTHVNSQNDQAYSTTLLKAGLTPHSQKLLTSPTFFVLKVHNFPPKISPQAPYSQPQCWQRSWCWRQQSLLFVPKVGSWNAQVMGDHEENLWSKSHLHL